MAARGSSSSEQPPRGLARSQTMANIPESAIDSEVVPSSLRDIATILRVANEIEPESPRVAYLCIYHLP
jgi:callose synthase